MLLSDIEIRAEIAADRLVFNPPIDVFSRRIDSSAVDLLLHPDLIIPDQNAPGIIVDPNIPDFHVMDLLERHGTHHSLDDGVYQLAPNRLIIGKTLEHIKLPNHLAARIEGKSTLARLGLSVHVTAPTVIAGFEGNLYLEMNNIGPFPIQLEKEMKIAQLILERVGLPPTRGYTGRYQEQT